MNPRAPPCAATLFHPTLATPEASPRRVGEGLGGALFVCRFIVPMRMHKQVEASQEPGTRNPEPGTRNQD